MYQPSKQILKKYADVLIKFALNSGKGVKKDEVVYLEVSESAKLLAKHLMLTVLEAGAHPVLRYLPENLDRTFYRNANLRQVAYVPKKILLARVSEVDHFVRIVSESDMHELEGIDSNKIVERSKAFKFYRDAMDTKEYQGKFTWVIGLYGTEAEAREAKMSLKQYWEQIIRACFLDYKDPIAKWKSVFAKQNKIMEKLNHLKITHVKIKGEDVDLDIEIGKRRRWVGGEGRNIPSFEIFTSPDWRGTQGWVRYDRPLYRYGNLIEGIELEFKNGKVVKSKARKNQKLLKEIIKVENANRVGEFSLTDKRFSRITKFMAETLYDENVGGSFGNFHIALGAAFKNCYDGDFKNTKDSKLEKLGFNLNCATHTDMMSTTDRIVVATIDDGRSKIIYKNGQFTI